LGSSPPTIPSITPSALSLPVGNPFLKKTSFSRIPPFNSPSGRLRLAADRAIRCIFCEGCRCCPWRGLAKKQVRHSRPGGISHQLFSPAARACPLAEPGRRLNFTPAPLPFNFPHTHQPGTCFPPNKNAFYKNEIEMLFSKKRKKEPQRRVAAATYERIMPATLSEWQSPCGTYSSPVAFRLPQNGLSFFPFSFEKKLIREREERKELTKFLTL